MYVHIDFRSQHLKEHILTHSKNNSKNFSCPVEKCDSKFSSKNLVYRHVKKMHRKENNDQDLSTSDLYDFGIKLSDNENEQTQEQTQLLSSQSICQLDSVTLLSGL